MSSDRHFANPFSDYDPADHIVIADRKVIKIKIKIVEFVLSFYLVIYFRFPQVTKTKYINVEINLWGSWTRV